MQTTSPKLPGIDCIAKNWALAMLLQALPFVHFWSILLLKSKWWLMTSFRKTLKTLVWSAQNQLITSEICPENEHKIGHFYRLLFGEVLRENFCKIPAKSTDFSAYLSLKILQNLTFFCALSEALAWVAVEWCPSVSQESFWDSVWPNC